MSTYAKEYIILSLEVDSWAGDIREAMLPDSSTFDYVRVYQNKAEAPPKSPCPPHEP